MSWNGAGVYSKARDWTTDEAGSVQPAAVRFDEQDDDFTTGLNNALCKDGQNVPTADIAWNSKLITGLGNATADSHALNRITGDGRYLPLAPSGAQLSKISGLDFPKNAEIVPSVASNALTLALKTHAGTDPSPTDPVTVFVRDATASSGAITALQITAALSLVVPASATLGVPSGDAFRVWLEIFNDAGTPRLGVMTPFSSVDFIFNLRPWRLASSTAIGTGADSAATFYTDSAVTSKAYAILGFVEWGSGGLTTAGTWDEVPDFTQVYGPGVPLPNEIVYQRQHDDSAYASGTTLTPWDNTTPQVGEGNQFMSRTFTPESAANLLQIEHLGHYVNSVQVQMTVHLHRDGGASAVKTGAATIAAAFIAPIGLVYRVVQDQSSSITWTIRAGGEAAGTTGFNGQGGSAKLNGTLSSYLRITEIMT